MKLLPLFKSFALPQIENGESILFWHDNWANQILATAAPELFSYAKNKMITAQKVFALDQDEFTDLFQLPISQVAFQQMQNVQQLIHGRVTTENQDRWSYSWGSDNFASAKVYRLLIDHQVIHPALKWL